ncbi:hypothetical protein [Kocuria rosea]|uniref:hypothetical protein n=1 Tax=Kocuria rosea TaxID=1275 RepID=UPI0011A6AB8B|nr:hypothetical protein [Kocuria rosea]
MTTQPLTSTQHSNQLQTYMAPVTLEGLEAEELLEALLEAEDNLVQLAPATILYAAQQAMEARAQGEHETALELLEIVASHPGCPAKALVIAAAHPSASLRMTVVGREDCPSLALEAAYARSEEEVRSAHAAARRYRRPSLARITYSVEDLIRVAIAHSPACPPQLLTALAHSKDAATRLAVASHPYTPLCTLEALLAISKTARPQQARRSIIEAGGAQICDQDGAVGYAEVTAAILVHPTYRARTVNNTRTRGGAA